MQILSAPADAPSQLEAMNRYGILGAYIPQFGLITGRMQYDLFHSYTVDVHILRVVRNIRRFGLPEGRKTDSAAPGDHGTNRKPRRALYRGAVSRYRQGPRRRPLGTGRRRRGTILLGPRTECRASRPWRRGWCGTTWICR